jgi:HTH-type transcriptional regulator/antitoxin HigA
MSQIKRYAHEPDYAVPPGRSLQETIDALGMDQKELAIRTGLDKKTVNQIIKGIHPLSQQTAIKLERATSVPARLWNNLEMQYQERLARQKDHERLKAALEWLKTIPTKVLINRGIIKVQPDKVAMLKEVLAFFGVSSTEEWKAYWLKNFACRFRRSKAFEMKPGAAATWIRLGEIVARDIECQPFNKEVFMNALYEIRRLTNQPPETWRAEMVSRCAKAGVAVALVQEIKGCPVSGLTRWLTPNKAIIQQSLRYKTDDHFWFTFFHEAGHILKDQKKAIFIEDGEDDKSEDLANRFAMEFLIPQEYVRELRLLKSKIAVHRFAAKMGIAPGIVAGQMQKREIAPHHFFNGLKRKLAWADSQ